MPALATNRGQPTFLRPLPNPEATNNQSPISGAAGKTTGPDLSLPEPITEPKAKFSLWDQKPWWCQPWTIVLTGLSVIAGSWWLLQIVWITALVFAAVVVWWLLFLVLVPRAYRESQG